MSNDKDRKRIIKKNVKNTFLLLKLSPHQIYKLCDDAKWNEVEVTRIAEERINALNQNEEILQINVAILCIVCKFLMLHNN